MMEVRRQTLSAAVQLAIVMSAAAAALALGLNTIADVSALALVSTVMIVGFVSSWVVTGRVARSVGAASHTHRVAIIPVRQSLS